MDCLLFTYRHATAIVTHHLPSCYSYCHASTTVLKKPTSNFKPLGATAYYLQTLLWLLPITTHVDPLWLLPIVYNAYRPFVASIYHLQHL